jgi:hypothetical protein
VIYPQARIETIPKAAEAAMVTDRAQARAQALAQLLVAVLVLVLAPVLVLAVWVSGAGGIVPHEPVAAA